MQHCTKIPWNVVNGLQFVVIGSTRFSYLKIRYMYYVFVLLLFSLALREDGAGRCVSRLIVCRSFVVSNLITLPPCAGLRVLILTLPGDRFFFLGSVHIHHIPTSVGKADRLLDFICLNVFTTLTSCSISIFSISTETAL